MNIIAGITAPVDLNRPVITIGTFDGLHLGHQSIFDTMKQHAMEQDAETAVITFNPHPRLVLGHQVYLLNTQMEKRALLAESGIHHMIEIPFTREFARHTANEFIEMIARNIKPRLVVIGFDHGFGQGRSGNISHFYHNAQKFDFAIKHVDELVVDGQKVSSSAIRWLLQEGQAQQASRLLGRRYEITGQVVRGNQIGRLIGYPTANLYIDDPNKLIPAMGVYASKVYFKNRIFNGMTNIGMRPTINAYKLTIETNIFDFDEDIYYESLTIQLVKRIRNEKKFGNLDLLKTQLKHDSIEAAGILSSTD
ncbi:MAG: bifunctional riboflavin kinase/FAD synthetase [Lentimicrobium sp.]|nr:bifunctional riboflavin kinase/FAD synthetase [Lentimicrobium sp.]MDD2528521.1 bifunctional riboflavin kinase/FAD synthetase [Lentimicrobiaceae bacterium]MDD4597518.1 bifunctional riboflavin kinase/FAD synthetase [Lentimicrobiaceae bacterium]MDY0025454.1 bifunctional riboflavin kinase/FAD synthetase [Lentimicrobium sp.]